MTDRNDKALGSVVRRLATYAKAMDVSTEFLPAIAPAAFGSNSFRMDAVGDPPLFLLDYFERGLTSREIETKDEGVLVKRIMSDVLEAAALVGALNASAATGEMPERVALVRATLLARLREVPDAAGFVENLA